MDVIIILIALVALALAALRTACPRRSAFATAAGSLILHSFCPPSLVTSLKADRGLHAFTHVPEREHQLLLGIAERPDCALTLAYTPTGEIVGHPLPLLTHGGKGWPIHTN